MRSSFRALRNGRCKARKGKYGQKQTTDMVDNIVSSNNYVTVSIFSKSRLWPGNHNVACDVIPIERR
jgi:hypothetical protein